MNNPTREAIERAISRVLSQSGRSAPAMNDDLVLGRDLKLDSLDLAQVVVQLEAELGYDPFRSQSHAIETLGDLVTVYSARDEAK